MPPTGAAGYLLDTCTVIDLAGEPERVAAPVRSLFLRSSTRLFVSAVSAWEVAIKTERGRLPGGTALIDAWDRHLEAIRADQMDVTHPDGLQAGALEWAHRDPFDRMLVVQSIRAGLHIATRDRTILTSGLVPVLDTQS